MCEKSQVIAIVGATGAGKSALADALALQLDGELISADSMQVYRGMDIGTAKIPAAQRSVIYHGIDLVDPGFPFTAALYQRHARAAIEQLLAAGKTPVLCGGTGLYVRVALDDFKLDEQRESATDSQSERLLRVRLTEEAEKLGAEAFHTRLAELDPQSAALIHPNNVRRVMRAFEMLEQGGSYARQHEGFSDFSAVYPARFLGIHVERSVLYEVIERRVDAMFAMGLPAEVQGLMESGFMQALTATQAIGYKELVPVLQGERELEDAILEIKQSTRRYAKRQHTWFKRDARIEWIDATELHRAMLAGKLSSEQLTHVLLERI